MLERFLSRVLRDIKILDGAIVHVGWDYAEHEGQKVLGMNVVVDRDLNDGDIAINVIGSGQIPGIVLKRIFSPTTLEAMEDSINGN